MSIDVVCLLRPYCFLFFFSFNENWAGPVNYHAVWTIWPATIFTYV